MSDTCDHEEGYHERDGKLLDRIIKKFSKGRVGKKRRIKVDPIHISTRATTRRAMHREIEEECRKIGVTYRKARRYMREELKMKPTLSNMHNELVRSKGGEPC
jgi:hypothetical protein